MSEDWSQYEIKPDSQASEDWSKYEVKPDRFNFEAKKISDIPWSVLKAGGVVQKVLASAADAALSKDPKDTLSNNLDRYFKSDPTYFPGDVSAERFSNDPKVQALIKTALDVGLDPNTIGSFFTGSATKAPNMIEQALEASPPEGPSTLMKGVGNVAQIATGGRMGPKWASSAEKVTPMEQIFANSTKDKAMQEYGPMKEAAEQAMAGRSSPLAEETFQNVERFPDVLGPPTKYPGLENPNFQNFDKTVQRFEDAVNKVQRSEGAVPPKLQVLLDRAKDIQTRGITSGPETAEIMDAINGLEYTGFGNPRLVRNILKGPQAELRGGLSDLTRESSPVYSDARQKVADLINVTAPQQGGKMSQYVMQNLPTLVGAGEAAHEFSKGNIKGGLAAGIGALLIRNPAAWNAVVGAGRGLPDLVSTGIEQVTQLLSSHPELMQAAKQALVQFPKADFNKTKETIKGLDLTHITNDPQKIQALGKSGQQLQEAAQRGPAAAAATNFILNQKDPEYREKIRQINGQEGQ